jgi:putative Mg2+ transporter-C (MgtC) family protein
MLDFSMVPVVNLELFGPVNFYIAFGVFVIMSTLLGGLVGFEREIKLKAAGIKTNMLICLGSCMYTAISLLNYDAQLASNDPNRVAAQIVSGIGFLGAGAIIQSKGGVTGLTTAATIWVVAAIGVVIGMGYPLTATIFTITVLVVLRIVEPFYRLFQRDNSYLMSVEMIKGSDHLLGAIFNECDVEPQLDSTVELDNNSQEVHFYIYLSINKLRRITGYLRQLKSVKKVTHTKISAEYLKNVDLDQDS